VLRLSGPVALSSVSKLITSALPAPRHAVFRRLTDPYTGALIDTGLVLIFPGPHSFTGEDSAELQVHGSRAVVTALSDVLVRLGLRPAEAGEFTRRALMNDKLSLTEVEGLGDLLEAETQQQLRLAHMQTTGSLKALYDDWRTRLLQLRADLEAELDFSDEELPDDLQDRVRASVQDLLNTLRRHAKGNVAAERVRGGIKVVIAGPPNAGKSTLLNTLAKRDVAIVSDEPGTTRDSLEVHLDLGGYPVTLVDTAGLRETASKVEREGIARAGRHIASAHIIVAMTAHGLDLPPLDMAPDLKVLNKSDLGEDESVSLEWIVMSLKTGAGLDQFLQALQQLVTERFSWGDQVVTGQARHHAALEQSIASLGDAIEELSHGAGDVVLAAEHLRQSAFALGRIVGRTDVEDVLGAIFSNFCIGK